MLILVLISVRNYKSLEQTFQLTSPNSDNFDLPQLGHEILPFTKTPVFHVAIYPALLTHQQLAPTTLLAFHMSLHPTTICPTLLPLFTVPYNTLILNVLTPLATQHPLALCLGHSLVYYSWVPWVALMSAPASSAIIQQILFPLTHTRDTTAKNIPHYLLLAPNSSQPIPSNKTWMSLMFANPDYTIMLESFQPTNSTSGPKRTFNKSALYIGPFFTLHAYHSHIHAHSCLFSHTNGVMLYELAQGIPLHCLVPLLTKHMNNIWSLYSVLLK